MDFFLVYFLGYLMLKSRNKPSIGVSLHFQYVHKIVDNLANLRSVILRSFCQGGCQLMSKLFPLLPVLVDHADVVVDVRTGLAVVNVGRIVGSFGGVTPKI